jgi:hypothetical protein
MTRRASHSGRSEESPDAPEPPLPHGRCPGRESISMASTSLTACPSPCSLDQVTGRGLQASQK